MFTPTEITAGTARLVAGQLTDRDVSALVTLMRKYFKHLETVYSYEYETKFSALTDADNDKKVCAEIAACLIKLEEFTFGSAAEMQGGSDAIYFKEKSRYFEYVEICFTKIYPMPEEMGPNGKIKPTRSTLHSSSIRGRRTMCN